MKRIVLALAVVAAAVAVMLGAWQAWTAEADGATFVINDVDPPEAGCGTPDYTTTDINSVIAMATVHDNDTLVLCEGRMTG
jgi:hypothetical protein